MLKDPICVLTPFACSVLFRRSGESVRRATRMGYVKTRLVVNFTGKQVRLIDLNDASKYWGKPNAGQIKEMRRNGVILEVQGKKYAVLHPFPLVASEGLLKNLKVED